MPLKVDAQLDTTLRMEGEPLYDEERMEAYCQEHNIRKAELSEAQKKPFIVGYMSFSLDDFSMD